MHRTSHNICPVCDAGDPCSVVTSCDCQEAPVKVYEARFKVSLAARVTSLLEKYPAVVSPNFLSWEGEALTGADTSAKLRALLATL
jgi:hypothetical protein